MTKQYYHYCKEFRVEIFSMSNFFSVIIKLNMENLVLVSKVVIVFTMEIMHK
jgi:hypothetical protein